MTIIQVKVKPNAKAQSFTEESDGSFTIRLQSPPVDGKANRELIRLISKKFNISKSQIFIKSGVSSRNKIIQILD